MGNSVAHSFHVAKGKFIKKMMIRLEECHDPSGSFADDQQIENNRLLCFFDPHKSYPDQALRHTSPPIRRHTPSDREREPADLASDRHRLQLSFLTDRERKITRRENIDATSQ